MHQDVQFTKYLAEFRTQGREWGFTDEFIQKCFEQALVKTCKQKRNKRWTKNLSLWVVVVRVLRIIGLCVLVLLAAACLLSVSKSTRNIVSRHTQSLIYPVLRVVRLLSLPLVRHYPWLTDWHEESCLVQNPFYQISNLDCWPCEQVRSVLDFSGMQNFTKFYYQSGIPFIVKDVLKAEIDFERLKLKFMESNTFHKAAPWLLSSNPNINLPNVLFETEQGKEYIKKQNYHVLWKMNTAIAARVIREICPRPYFIPLNTEVSIQRFIFMDGSASPPYNLPKTEFANVWVVQGSGRRLLVLEPSDQCQRRCHLVSVTLEPKDLLYYNWQFWNLRSLPVGNKNSSVTIIGSFY